MVLRPLKQDELKEIFDETAQKIINYYLDRAVKFQPELMEGQKELPIQVPKEHAEQWLAQALGAQSVGAGSYPVDVYLPGKFGADIKVLSWGKGKKISGETSLAQKFEEAGADLDTLFKNQQHDEILLGWKKILTNKLRTFVNDMNVNDIYYFFFLRADTKFYLCGCKVDYEEIRNVKVNKNRTTDKNVFVDDFIDKEYGNIKIYKAKKRM